jgi:hypothetical protein
LSREFASKGLERRHYSQSLTLFEAAILKNSLFFSLLAGKLVVETGSTWTASATNNFQQVVFLPNGPDELVPTLLPTNAADGIRANAAAHASRAAATLDACRS